MPRSPVLPQHLPDRPERPHPSGIEQHSRGAGPFEQSGVVGGEHQDAGPGHEPFQPPLGLLDEGRITDPDPFVHQQDLGLDAGAHREGEPQHHAGRVGVHRHRQVVAQLGECRDLLRAFPDLRRSESEEHPPHRDVLVSRGAGVDAERYVEQRSHPAPAPHPPPRRLVDAREHPQQGRLPRAVGADQPHPVPARKRKVHVLQRAHRQAVAGVPPDAPARALVQQVVLQGAGVRAVHREIDVDAGEPEADAVAHTQ